MVVVPINPFSRPFIKVTGAHRLVYKPAQLLSFYLDPRPLLVQNKAHPKYKSLRRCSLHRAIAHSQHRKDFHLALQKSGQIHIVNGLHVQIQSEILMTVTQV